MAGLGVAGHGLARQGKVRHGSRGKDIKTLRNMARLGTVGLGKARLGVAG